ncbi:prolyl oligopeptidase family serine peptidase [Weeksellaceae bacterium KMM 9713]|uniref:prolyl oligopeptidase n=1 Tax=Profundicola chukchiensis TaxID=2961959 RepID=A0A9X4RU34_9FLAO|nr:prolyl oligopeptidase family serine peptidase [Profundicola chukchiensis]MDG4945286.1 prolyl oligopeptidase family serine peptidase [Profundicola chukchiensis]
MKKTVIAGLAFTFMACSTQQTTQKDTSLKYPETKKGNVAYTHFGTTVQDPYRWLEDDLAEDTKAWVKSQNEVTNAYLAQIPFRDKIKKEMTDLWNYEKIGSPFKEGDWTYFYKNDGLQQHSVLYRKKENGEPEVFLDPNKFSKDGTTSLAGLSFTKDGSLAGYSISEGGSDWRKIIIIDTKTKRQVEDTLVDVKFSGISWKGNEGFFYSSYDKPKGASELSAKTSQHKLYYHKLGTPQSSDQLIFGGEKTPRRYVGGGVSEDGRYLIVSAAESTTGSELYIRDLKNNQKDFTVILDNFDTTTNVVDTDGDNIYLLTNLNAPNNRLVRTTIQNPTPENWVDVIPETDKVLSVGTAGGFLFAKYMKDVNDQVLQYKYDGSLVREISLPGLGSVGGFGGKKEEKELYYSFSNYIYPSTIFKYDVISGDSKLYQKPQINFTPENYESKQVFYTSKDGTKVPMTIVYKKGLELNGKNPTILYAYGGFNISLRPGFSVVTATWIENGGVYAVANLRGGGEYGKKWHDGGRQLNKKNVFNDFIAAAEYLQSKGYTSPQYTAISGGSNGGLLVGAVQTMRPDLFKVALPAVGVLDMLRYHTFTAGAGWAYDYGTAEDSKEMFEYIKSYSPVHNVKAGTCYPSTMVTTGDHDDRVVPAHSYKFAAELQDKQACSNPTLIRIETKAGHGAGKPTELIIEENTDKLAFALYEMGIRNLK